MRAPGGLPRLHAFVDFYLRYVERDIFPGGCFFAAALTEMNMQPGPVRDRLVAVFDSWLGTLAETVREGQAKGELDPSEDPDQLAFELEAAFFLANNQFVIKHSSEPLAAGPAHDRAAARRDHAPAVTPGPRSPFIARNSSFGLHRSRRTRSSQGQARRNPPAMGFQVAVEVSPNREEQPISDS